jgi:hypothetical protein
MWVLTREINQYEQDGEYYVQAFLEKPSEQELSEFVPKGSEAWVHSGGGRQDSPYRGLDNEWFHLREVH